jgi:hypothetical protein
LTDTTEVIHRRGPWRHAEAVEFATLEWVDWFNNRRLLEPIGNMPPAEAERRYFEQLKELLMVASLKRNSLRDSRRGSKALARLMPAGAVENQHGVCTRSELCADFPRVLRHRFAVDRRHDDGGADAALRADGTEQVDGVMAVVAHRRRSRTARRPDIGQGALLANAGLVGKPDLERFAGRCGRDRRGDQAGEIFLKMSYAAASVFG